MDKASIPNLSDLRARRAAQTAEAVNHLGAFVDAFARTILLLLALLFSALARFFVFVEESWRDDFGKALENHPEFKTRGLAAGIVWPDPPPEGGLACSHPKR